MNYKYNIGDKVKFYDNEYQEDREVTIVGFDSTESYPWYEVKEEGEEVTWYLNEEAIEACQSALKLP
jgi:beta-glucanase (GH16 family)